MKNKNIIVDFIFKNKMSYIIGLIFMLFGTYVQTIFPRILGDTIDILSTDNFNKTWILKNIAIIMLVSLVAFTCTYIWRNLIIRNSRKLEGYLRERLYTHLQKMGPEFYSKRKTGDLIAYAINDIGAVRMTLGPASAMAINGMGLSVATVAAMSRTVNFKLAMMCLIPIPIIILLIIKVGKYIRIKFKRVQESFSDISGKIQENIYGIRVIKAYAQEAEELKNFEELNNNMMDANLSMVRLSAVISPVIELCFSISFVTNLIIGGNMVLKGEISLGGFVAFNTYLTMIMVPIMNIGRIINIIQRGAASYKRLIEILNVKPDIKDGLAMVNSEINGNIKINNLSFAYPQSEINALEHIDIEIRPGGTLGIIGKTGSGKTTLVNLLLKLHNVENNKILIDGIDINDYSLENLRNAFGYVPQDAFLFHATVKENIGFFKNSYTVEEIENSVKNSCIYESIKNLSEGFDTVLGERGVNLSGGQKQRVSIARALIKDPPILILDDSLSAVDTVTEKRILDNFKALRRGKSTIIISHKISSISHADEIILLDEGKICERGTHEELIEKRGDYYEIYQEQSGTK
ncbi:MAG: ABC transporter ATP-binding protein [Clostridium sp.]